MTEMVIDQAVYQALMETVGEDFIGEMLEAFLEEGAQFLVDMNSALADRDVDKFRRAAHSQKSNAATFGAMKLSELARELEEMARNDQLADAAEKLGPLSAAFAEAGKALKDTVQ